MEKYVISQDLAQRIMNYIVEPHKELLSIIEGLQKLEIVKTEDKEATIKEKK